MIARRTLPTLIFLGCLSTQLTVAQPWVQGQTLVNGPGVPISSFVPLETEKPSPKDTSSTGTRFKLVPLPNDKPYPNETNGGGTRGGGLCSQDQPVLTPELLPPAAPSLMALTPTDSIGLTYAEKPAFYIYVPETAAKQIVLSIVDENQQHHSQVVREIEGTPQIFRIQPPADSPALSIDKDYRWSVVLVCQERPRPDDPSFFSWVRRVALAPNLQQQSTLMTPIDQAVMYGEQGIWFDAVESVAQARYSKPDDPEMALMWSDILESVGLINLSNVPLRF